MWLILQQEEIKFNKLNLRQYGRPKNSLRDLTPETQDSEEEGKEDEMSKKWKAKIRSKRDVGVTMRLLNRRSG
jgi:hypothetical protein